MGCHRHYVDIVFMRILYKDTLRNTQRTEEDTLKGPMKLGFSGLCGVRGTAWAAVANRLREVTSRGSTSPQQHKLDHVDSSSHCPAVTVQFTED